MELQELISETLCAIRSGIAIAEKESGKAVLPPRGLVQQGDVPCVTPSAMGRDAKVFSNVVFEVSIAQTQTKEGKTGIGVLLGAISAGGAASDTSKHDAYSKVGFNIPLDL